jgi:hypothetical protein
LLLFHPASYLAFLTTTLLPSLSSLCEGPKHISLPKPASRDVKPPGARSIVRQSMRRSADDYHHLTNQNT